MAAICSRNVRASTSCSSRMACIDRSGSGPERVARHRLRHGCHVRGVDLVTRYRRDDSPGLRRMQRSPHGRTEPAPHDGCVRHSAHPGLRRFESSSSSDRVFASICWICSGVKSSVMSGNRRSSFLGACFGAVFAATRGSSACSGAGREDRRRDENDPVLESLLHLAIRRIDCASARADNASVASRRVNTNGPAARVS
jgi:hypothetical protein